MFKRMGGVEVKGFLNNVQKTALFLQQGFPKLTIKTRANFQVQIPEKLPWLCKKKQGPLLRKSAMVKHKVQ